MAQLQNNRPRLITLNVGQKVQKDPETGKIINVERGQIIDLLPGKPAGPATTVPDELLETRYVKALVKQGDVSVVVGADESDDDDDLSGLNKAELIERAELFGVEVQGTMTKDQIKAAIREVTDQ